MSKINNVEDAQELMNEMKDLRRVPDRVLVREDEGVPFRRALSEYHTFPDVLFIRDDGWVLGAPSHLEGSAYNMWNDTWIGYVRRPSFDVQDIKDYKHETG